MLNKIILVNILNIIFAVNLFSHEAKVSLFVENLKNDFINVKARRGENGPFLSGLSLKILSIVSNKELQEKVILSKKGITLKIPKESYSLILSSSGPDIILDGPAPSSGFKRTAKRELFAFKYTSIVSSIFIVLSLLIIFRRKYTLS